MPIKVRCPSCGDAFKTSSKNRGHKVDCPLCSVSIRVSKSSRGKKSKQAASSGTVPEGDDGGSIDSEIAAVLAEGEELPREFVPSSPDGDDSDLFEAVSSDTGEDLCGNPATVPSGPDVSYDGLVVPKFDEGTPPKAFSVRQAAAPFGAGLLIGAALASVAWTVLGGGSAPVATAPGRPAPNAPVAPKSPVKVVSDIAPEAPPEDDEAKAALLAKLSLVSARFETGGGLLGGGRSLVLTVRNESGLVLKNVTVAATLSLAAFSDSEIAEERVIVPFLPVLGVGEQQEVRFDAPSGGNLATVKLAGPVRLTGEIVDVEWQNDDDF